MIEYMIPSGKSVRLTDSQKNELLDGCMARWVNWNETIADIRDRSVESWQLYLENRPDHLYYNNADDAAISSSRVRRPVLEQAVDGTIAQQHLASFPSDERFFKAKPLDKETGKYMDVYEKHVETRLSMVDFMVNSYKDRKNMMLDGVSCVWHPFIRKTETKIKYTFPEQLGLPLISEDPQPVPTETVTLEATGFIPLSLSDWVVDPKVDNLEEANLIWRRWIEVEKLKAIRGLNVPDNLTAYSHEETTDTNQSDKDLKYEYLGIQRTYQEDDYSAATMALVYEEWGDFYLDGEIFENHVLVQANDCHVLYFGPNPYAHGKKPFTVTPYIPICGTLYGKSLSQAIIPLCHVLDGMLNQTVDIIKNAIPAFTYLTSDTALLEFFSDGVISVMPGEGIPVKDHNSIKQLQGTDLGAVNQLFTAMMQLKEEIRESTGGVSYATGTQAPSDPERTATETNALVSGTNTRFQLLIQVYEEYRLKQYLHMIYENDRQYMTQEAYVEDENEELMPNTVKSLNLTFDVTGSRSIMNRAKEIQDYDMLMQNYIPALIQAGYAQDNGDRIMFDVPEIFKRRAAMSNIRDLDNVMEVVKLEEQQQAMPQLGALPDAMGAVQPVIAGPAAADMAAA